MSFSVTEEQEELRQVVRRFLDENSSSEQVRRLMDSSDNRDPKVWSRMAEQLGLPALVIPEKYGGAGFGAVELGIVLEEMGRALLVSPYFSTVALAAQTLVASDGDAAKRRWLPAIADGSLTATVAFVDDASSCELESIRTTARNDDGAWTVSGVKMFVPDGHTADLLLVAACTEDGLGLFAVDGHAAGLTRSRLDTVDMTRGLARVELDSAAATPIGSTADATPLLREATDLLLAASAAEQIGGAAKCLDMAVEYAKVREQFGRPIGSFQAIKHKCANLLLKVESGKSAVYHATSVVAEGDSEASTAAALAKAYCSEAFTHAAKENIQIHGGVGFTWEHDAHLYLKRAKSAETLFGSPAWHRARLADLVGI